MELVIVLLWFVLPVAACVAAMVVNSERFTDLVHLYLFVNYGVLSLVCGILLLGRV